jgi:hypothetical protein
MVPPSVQSHTMVDNNMPRRDPNAMDVDTHQAMVDMGYAVDVIVDPPDMGYGNPDMGYEEAAPDMGYEEAAPDMGYEEAAPTIGEMGYGDDNATDDADMGYEETAIDLGYEPAAPSVAAAAPRRGSMSANEQTQRRASIKAIMADPAISPMAKRRSIHHLMDGRRQSLTGGTNLPQSGNKSMHNPYAAPDLSEGDRHCTSTSQGHFIANEQTKIAEEKRPVCTHYDRKCTLIAPCCGAAFGCRICHDECAVLPPKINNGSKRYHRSASLPSSFTSMETSQPEDTHHNIDRFAVREVICRECFTRQSSKTYVLSIQPCYCHPTSRNSRDGTYEFINLILTFFLPLLLMLSFLHPHYIITATTVSTAVFFLVTTIAIPATSGCRTKSIPITAKIVAFAASAAKTTFNIATLVECALIRACTTIIIASRASIRVTAPCAKNISLAVAVLRTKCLVGMRFTGNAFVSWQPTTVAAPSVKRRPRHGNV